jgi:hypothetical protein
VEFGTLKEGFGVERMSCLGKPETTKNSLVRRVQLCCIHPSTNYNENVKGEIWMLLIQTLWLKFSLFMGCKFLFLFF